MPRVRLAPFAVIIGLVVLTACSSSTKSTPSTTRATSPTSTSATPTTVPPTTPPPSTVKILSLTGPPSPVVCNAPTQVQLHWDTRGATKVELRIDGGPIFSTYPGGAREPLVPLTCDANPHTYELTARGANGHTATKTLELAERKLVT